MAHIEPYQHDCDRCMWVGWLHVKGGGKWGSDWGNVYYCPEPDPFVGGHGSVVIRFSDEPSDYWSLPVGVGMKGSLSLGDETPNHHCAESCGDDPKTPAKDSECPIRRRGDCPEEGASA